MVGVVKEGSFIIEIFFQHSFIIIIIIIITIIVQISTRKILVLLLCAQLALHQSQLATWASCTQSSGTKTTHVIVLLIITQQSISCFMSFFF